LTTFLVLLQRNHNRGCNGYMVTELGGHTESVLSSSRVITFTPFTPLPLKP
jgi:hypothetical protein